MKRITYIRFIAIKCQSSIKKIDSSIAQQVELRSFSNLNGIKRKL